MEESWKISFFFMILFVAIQAFFSMMEMALVSFNRVRLQYYVAEGRKGADRISKLLSNPTILFGTTLIGINASLQIGSEFARRFYIDVGLQPEFAPLTQIILVVLFGELIPMFAARSHAEHAAMLGIRLLYVCSWIFYPFILCLQIFTKLVNYLFGSGSSFASYLTREELQRAIESRAEKGDTMFSKELNTISDNIFALKGKTPLDLMIPLSQLPKFQDNITVEQLKDRLTRDFSPYIALYHEKPENIFGIVFSRDLLRISEHTTVKDLARSTWFVTEKNSIHQILGQFRSTSQQLAVVLDENGKARGVITLDAIINEIFYLSSPGPLKTDKKGKKQNIFIDRSFPAHTEIEEINQKYQLHLPENYGTLDALMADQLGHIPKKGEEILFGDFIFSVEDSPLMVEKSIRIRNH
ncbi:MAG: HlyC/CorC family transporter [Chlamydiae bacterium]|nr:HlyC/CorC family transporter [Chlamydiota bacterium]